VLVFVFVGHVQRRDVIDSSEGTLHWVPLERIEELNLVPDLPLILARILTFPASESPMYARSSISPDGNTLYNLSWDAAHE
jgi:hypothetical protein